MSVQEPRQFTPAQVLEAARRAEGEGRLEFAAQLYRHLVTHHPGSMEASGAQSALARLGNVASTAPGGRRPGPPPATGHAAPGGQFEPSLGNPFEPPRPPEPSFAPLPSPQGYGQPPPRPGPPPEASEAPEHAVELPAPVRDYRTARLIAGVATWLGGLTALTGMVLLPATVMVPKVIAGTPILGKLVAGPSTGASLFVGGLAMIVTGQLVRALLDQAIATRDMAALARAEAEARFGEPRRRSRRRRG